MRAIVTLYASERASTRRTCSTPRPPRLTWPPPGVGPLDRPNAMRSGYAPASRSGHRALDRCRVVPTPEGLSGIRCPVVSCLERGLLRLAKARCIVGQWTESKNSNVNFGQIVNSLRYLFARFQKNTANLTFGISVGLVFFLKQFCANILLARKHVHLYIWQGFICFINKMCKECFAFESAVYELGGIKTT